MTIGEALKQERLKLGLSQKDMASNIFSVANYSKIERDLQDIKAIDLFKLLQNHNIDFQKFAEKIGIELSVPSNDDVIKNDLSHQIIDAFYKADAKKAIELNKVIQKTSSDKELKIRSQLITAVVTNTVDKLDPQIENEVSKILFENENWTIDIMTLRLFCNSMILFSNRHLLFAIKEIIDQYNNNINSYSTHVQYLICAICSNYLQNCYLRHIRDYSSDIFFLLDQMPIHPQLLFFKIISRYYKALFAKDIFQINDCKNDLKKYGYDRYLKILPE